ncbi:MAG: holo-ACP synthase [Helicobacter sp.]|nr:holo-ACP synthase [Helicobacter sp.]
MLEIGIDIVAIHRLESLQKRFGNKGLLKFLCEEEIKLIKSPQTLAGFWAAKEACAKALKCGISPELSFYDMKISKTKKNAPILKLSQEKMAFFGVSSISLSIAHDKGFAIAVVAISLKT